MTDSMSEHAGASPGRRHRLAVASVVTLGAIAVFAAGVAVAAVEQQVVRERPVAASGTVSVTAPSGAPATRALILEFGDFSVWAECEAGPGSLPGYPYGLGIGGSAGVTNHGADGVVVTWDQMEYPDTPEDGFMWLEAGQSDPVFWAGEIINEEDPSGIQGQVWTFGLLDHRGSDRSARSATGTIAFSARLNPGNPDVSGDEFGECVFSAEVAG